MHRLGIEFLKHLVMHTEEITGDYQRDFRKGRSSTEGMGIQRYYTPTSCRLETSLGFQ